MPAPVTHGGVTVNHRVNFVGACLLALVLAGCASGTPDSRHAASASPSTSATPTETPSATPTTPTPTPTATPAETPSETPTETPSPSPSAEPSLSDDAAPSPASPGQVDHGLTPGHVFADAAAAKICMPGYAGSARNVTVDTRRAVFTAYHISFPPPLGRYELDHLIPLELGGDNTAANLWPQIYHGADSADVKDHLENHLHDLVCAGKVPLAEAQQAIAGDWAAAAAKYNSISTGTTAPPAQAPAPAPAPQRPAPAPAPAPANPVPGGGATAKCNDGTLSFAAHHQGACSSHGGVSVFYK